MSFPFIIRKKIFPEETQDQTRKWFLRSNLLDHIVIDSQIHSGTCKDRTLFMREVPVYGNGIADLLVFSWSSTLTPWHPRLLILNNLIQPSGLSNLCCRWRRGMMQAHRYKYFSHASILVLPKNKMKSVKPELDLFRKLRVGLWGFLPENKEYYLLLHPSTQTTHIAKHAQKAIRLATQAIFS